VTSTTAAPPVIENESLVRDLVAWVAGEPRPYAEVMDAWRTSCPRLSIWEDAVALGLVACQRGDGGTTVSATPAGRALLSRSPRQKP
jgi:hypothetical protein